MKRKPHPSTAARLVGAHLATLGVTVSDRQSKDLVAIVEGYPGWQSFQAAQSPKKKAASKKAPAPASGESPSAYDLAWAAVKDVIEDRMQTFHKAIQDYFGAAIAQKEMTLHAPILDIDADEFSGWMWLEDAEGRSLLTAKLALVEDESDAVQGFTLRFELEAPCDDQIVMSWVATPRFGPGAWVPLWNIEDLVAKLPQDLTASEVVYAIQDAGIFR